MTQDYSILNTNPDLVLRDSIYRNRHHAFRETTLSSYLRLSLEDIFTKARDKSLFSEELENLSITDELRDALSAQKHPFLRLFNYENINHVLDLSQDFGGIAHFLADHCSTVESLKIDPLNARLAALRCVEKDNVCHMSTEIETLVFEDSHYDLIILGEAEDLGLDNVNFAQLLSKLNQSLTENGCLVASFANSNRLDRWFDPDSQNSNIDFADLYLESADESVTTFERKQIRDLLLATGFACNDIFGNFSKGRKCHALFSEDYLTASVNGLNHFYRLGSIENSEINEFLIYQALRQRQKNPLDFATRYLTISGCSSSNTRALYDCDFAHFPGTGRYPEWRNITYRPRANAEVLKLEHCNNSRDSEILAQNTSAQPFHKGDLLASDWLNAILAQDDKKFTGLVEEYSNYLNEFETSSEFQNSAFDMLPFNIVVQERKGQRLLNQIDLEWTALKPINASFILARALFWFAFENKPLLKDYCKRFDIQSLGHFVVRHHDAIHQIQDLKSFVELEEEFQNEISQAFVSGSVGNALNQGFRESNSVLSAPRLEVSWSDADGSAETRTTQYSNWTRSPEWQSITLNLGENLSKHSLLRIDPCQFAAVIEIKEILVQDIDKTELLRVDSIDACAASENIIQNQSNLVCTNSDPYLLLDLSGISKLDAAHSICITLRWLISEHSSPALDALQQAVNDQNVSLVGQSNKLNEYRAEVDYLNVRITDLTKLLNHENKLSQTENRLLAEIHNLKEQLHTQFVRNAELHSFLLMLPSVRFKRSLQNLVRRLQGRPPAEIIPSKSEEEIQQEHEKKEHEELHSDKELIGQNKEDYGKWLIENSLDDAAVESAKAEIEAMEYKPIISVLVPIYNTPPEYLIPMVESVRNQIYPYWELCLVDDCSPNEYLAGMLEQEAAKDERIKIQINKVNQGISVTSNDALALASGDYIALLDHDDELSVDALYENAKVINTNRDAGLIYSDEDKMDLQGNRLEPYFKPDYSPDLLDTNNYICHLSVMKKEVLEELGGFREGLDGSQDHDVIMRVAHHSKEVVHIPKILYHWRKIPGSTAVVYDAKSYAWEAGRRAVEDQLQKNEDGVSVQFGSLKGTYRVFREIKGDPLVSIVIPFKDKPELLDSCLSSILHRSSYNNIEIIGVSNNSDEPLTHERMKAWQEQDSRVSFYEKNVPFNYSRICNYGVEQANGEYILLLNNDIEIISPDWIERLLEHAQRPQNGAVGGKLLFPDGRIQHAGIVVGMVGAAGHPHKFFPDNHIGYHGRLHMVYNVSAVTGAMLMVSKTKYLEVGGLDEKDLAVAYNDVDLCLKLMDAGYTNVFTPHSKATHHESVSRGYEDTDEKMQRLLKEQSVFLTRWAEFLENGDPYYNPNLSLNNERFSLNFKD